MPHLKTASEDKDPPNAYFDVLDAILEAGIVTSSWL